jgi:hypothetical protein
MRMNSGSQKPQFRRNGSNPHLPASQGAQTADKYQRYVLWVGAIAAMSAVAQAGITGWQAWEAKKGGDKMEIQVERIVSAASQIASSADKSNVQSKWALEKTLGVARESLDLSLQAHRVDQRAWLSFSDYKQDAEAAVGKARVVVSILNTGKTPALNAASISSYGFLPTEPQEVVGTPEGWNHVSSVFPGRAYSGLAISLDSFPTGPIIEAYKQKQLHLYIRTLTCYRDVSGNTHWVKTCAWHTSGQALGTFTFCPTGNDSGSDREGKVCKGYSKALAQPTPRPGS